MNSFKMLETKQNAKTSGHRNWFQPGHPLHKFYAYSHQPLSSIIQSQLRGETRVAQSDTEAVLIIDCTSQVDLNAQNSKENLDALARAYCSENGFNALLSRKGRNCLSCSIREARALDFRVIIRVGIWAKMELVGNSLINRRLMGFGHYNTNKYLL